MNKTLCAVAIAALSVAALTPAMAQESPWQVRVRAVNLDPANKTEKGLDLAVNAKLIPEVDISYFFTPNLAAELVLTYPQKQKLSITHVGEIGTFKHLPPTLLLQYHFTDFGNFRPYVGAGVNWTRISDVHFSPGVKAALHPSLEKNSFGAAGQIGFDYKIAPNVYFNVDVKKVGIETNVKSSGTKVGELKLDPWLIGVGIGYRF